MKTSRSSAGSSWTASWKAVHRSRSSAAGAAGSVRTGAAVVTGQVDQFAADLFGGQAEELAGAGRGDGGQGPDEADGRVLEHVPGLLPAADGRVVAEHLAGEEFEPGRAPADEVVARGQVARLGTGQEGVQDGGVERGV